MGNALIRTNLTAIKKCIGFEGPKKFLLEQARITTREKMSHNLANVLVSKNLIAELNLWRLNNTLKHKSTKRICTTY